MENVAAAFDQLFPARSWRLISKWSALLHLPSLFITLFFIAHRSVFIAACRFHDRSGLSGCIRTYRFFKKILLTASEA
jgi:hypothetical protein